MALLDSMLPELDGPTLEVLEQLNGDEALFRELIEILHGESERLLGTLHARLPAADWEACAAAAHSLEGALANFRAPLATEAASCVELAAQEARRSAAELKQLDSRVAHCRAR